MEGRHLRRLGLTDTERVSTTAFLSKIRPDWADADAGVSRGFLPPSYLLLFLSIFSLGYCFLSFDFSAPAAYIAVCQRFLSSLIRSHKHSHEPYAKWSILIFWIQPAVPGLLLYQIVAYIRPYFPAGQAIQKLADLTATALRDKCFYPVSRKPSQQECAQTRGKGLKGNHNGGAIDQPLFPPQQ